MAQLQTSTLAIDAHQNEKKRWQYGSTLWIILCRLAFAFYINQVYPFACATSVRSDDSTSFFKNQQTKNAKMTNTNEIENMLWND